MASRYTVAEAAAGFTTEDRGGPTTLFGAGAERHRPSLRYTTVTGHKAKTQALRAGALAIYSLSRKVLAGVSHLLSRTGKSILNVVPSSLEVKISIPPSSESQSSLTIANPRPSP